MPHQKKVVDLIYIEPAKAEAELVKDFRIKIDFWLTKLKDLQEVYFERDFDTNSPDVNEVLAMRRFLSKFLLTRIEWIQKNAKDKKICKKYLNVLPPFPQKGGIKTLLLHFFQIIETEDKKSILFKSITDQEKEVRVLWDLYKLRKTIESINILLHSLQEANPFTSMMTVAERQGCLTALKRVFTLMFQVIIQPQYRKELFQQISAKHVEPTEILKRKQAGQSYVFPRILEKFDYRNQFFFIYYNTGMKAKIGGEVKEFRFNYLDFEIIKQEFLINWLNQKLKNNPKKIEIYKRISFGGKTFDQIILEDPSKELEILKTMPINIFNDLTAEINSELPPEEQTTMETFSENQGEFAEVLSKFKKAGKLAKLSLNKLKEFVTASAESKEEAQEKPAPPATPTPPPEPEYQLIRLKKKEIDFPYLQQTVASYTQRLSLLRIKSDPIKYTNFAKRLNKLFNSISESILITRRTPKHEWVLPYLIKEKLGGDTKEHFIILGAEVKSKQLGMGYNPKSTQGQFQFTPFFVYGSDEKNNSLGEETGSRNIRGKELYELDFKDRAVQDKAYFFLDKIFDKH